VFDRRRGGRAGRFAFHKGYDEARKNIEKLTVLSEQRMSRRITRHRDPSKKRVNQARCGSVRLGLPLLAQTASVTRGPEANSGCLHQHTEHSNRRAGRLLERNDERHLRSSEEMILLFSDLPQAITHWRTSARLGYTLAELGYEFPRYPVPEGETMDSFFESAPKKGSKTLCVETRR